MHPKDSLDLKKEHDGSVEDTATSNWLRVFGWVALGVTMATLVGSAYAPEEYQVALRATGVLSGVGAIAAGIFSYQQERLAMNRDEMGTQALSAGLRKSD